MAPCFSDDQESANSFLIEDFQDISDWTIDGAKEVKLIDDPEVGRCLQWKSASRNATTMVKNLDSVKDRMTKCDAIVFDYWLDGYMSNPAMTLFHVPGYSSSRNWYFKFSNRDRRVWRTAWFELKLDDDSLSNDKEPSTRLQLAFAGWQAGPEPDYEWRIRNIRAVSFPVTLDYDESKKNFEEREGHYLYRYDLKVKNRGQQDRECAIVIDRAKLKRFNVEAPEELFPLKAGEERIIPATISIPVEKALSLEPLYLEEAPIWLRVKGLAETDTAVMRGWQVLPLLGAVPPRFAVSDRPRTRCDAIRLAHLRDWRRRELDFIKGFAVFKIAADDALAGTAVYPDTAGGYSLGFLCPDCQADLRPRSLTEQYCPRCNKTITGNKALNHKAVTFFHTKNANDAYACSLVYALTGEKKYAERAKEVLLRYAELAPTMKVVNPLATGYSNILGWAILGESYLCSGFPWAYDFLMAAGALSQAESERIEEGLLLPMLKRMSLHNASYSNQTAEYRSNQMSIALTCGHWVMAARALNWAFGFWELVDFAFDDDGWTVEGSQGYQTGAVVCLEEISEAAHYAGADVYDHPKYKKILTLGVSSALLFTRYHDPFSSEKLGTRSLNHYHHSQIWFFVTPKRIPEMSLAGVGIKSTVRESAGYTFLRFGLPTAFTGVDVNWGQTWERGEHDLFSFRIYLGGRRVDSEVGRIAYTNPYSAFMDKSIAASGIVVDEGNCTINRQLSCLIDGADRFAACMVTTDPKRPLYEGVGITRYFLSLPQGVLLVDLVTSDKEHNLDWPFFSPAQVTTSLTDLEPVQWAAAKGSGYDVPYELRSASTSDSFWMEWPVEGKQARMTLAGSDAKEVVIGMARGRWDGHPIPFCVTRKRGVKRSIAVTFFETFEKEPVLRTLTCQDKEELITATIELTTGNSISFDLRPPQIEEGRLADPGKGHYVSLSTF